MQTPLWQQRFVNRCYIWPPTFSQGAWLVNRLFRAKFLFGNTTPGAFRQFGGGKDHSNETIFIYLFGAVFNLRSAISVFQSVSKSLLKWKCENVTQAKKHYATIKKRMMRKGRISDVLRTLSCLLLATVSGQHQRVTNRLQLLQSIWIIA